MKQQKTGLTQLLDCPGQVDRVVWQPECSKCLPNGASENFEHLV